MKKRRTTDERGSKDIMERYAKDLERIWLYTHELKYCLSFARGNWTIFRSSKSSRSKPLQLTQSAQAASK